MMPPFDIVLADDHVLVRQGIKKILQQDDDMRVVAEAGDGVELMEILENITPDLVILDISMPRLKGLVAAAKIRELYPDIKVLILSMHRSKEYLQQALAVGREWLSPERRCGFGPLCRHRDGAPGPDLRVAIVGAMIRGCEDNLPGHG